ncbi:LysR substrate-binding domain-containing protein [Aquipuribacter sp. SD81]|uniref:LysR substrate-binding domain-containing protein n=1 Tax=Aquipuribacter sp. SD81 TaxID=3127703 RepID=UPI0030183847
MDVDALRWFQQVADGATVTDVAAVEHVSQPGVSRALARLEREVGAPLLVRQGRLLRMTRAGTLFKRHVDAALHTLDDGVAAVEQLSDPESGTVHVRFERSLGAWLVPQLVRDFQREHPRVRLVLEPAPPGAEPDDPQVDVALTSRRPTGGTHRWRRLLTEPVLLAVPARHALVGRERVALTEVRHEPLVLLAAPAPFRGLVDGLLRAADAAATDGPTTAEPGGGWDVRFEVSDLATVQGLVAAGLGLALVPASAVDGRTEVLPLSDVGATRDVGVVWPSGGALLPSARLFLSHVADVVGRGHVAVAYG